MTLSLSWVNDITGHPVFSFEPRSVLTEKRLMKFNVAHPVNTELTP